MFLSQTPGPISCEPPPDGLTAPGPALPGPGVPGPDAPELPGPEGPELPGVEAIYDAAGRKLARLQRGVNVLRLTDGTVRKLIVK